MNKSKPEEVAEAIMAVLDPGRVRPPETLVNPTKMLINPQITPAELMRLIPNDEQNMLMQIGQQRDEQHWFLGNRMCEKVDTWGWPVGQTATVYAMMVKYRNERRVREFYYCSHFYQAHPELYIAFHDVADWDVFNLARKCEDPQAVLTAKRDEGYTLAELEQLFKVEQEDPAPPKLAEPKYPMFVKPIIRWMHNRVAIEKWDQVEQLVDSFLAHLRELTEER